MDLSTQDNSTIISIQQAHTIPAMQGGPNKSFTQLLIQRNYGQAQQNNRQLYKSITELIVKVNRNFITIFKKKRQMDEDLLNQQSPCAAELGALENYIDEIFMVPHHVNTWRSPSQFQDSIWSNTNYINSYLDTANRSLEYAIGLDPKSPDKLPAVLQAKFSLAMARKMAVGIIFIFDQQEKQKVQQIEVLYEDETGKFLQKELNFNPDQTYLNPKLFLTMKPQNDTNQLYASKNQFKKIISSVKNENVTFGKRKIEPPKENLRLPKINKYRNGQNSSVSTR